MNLQLALTRLVKDLLPLSQLVAVLINISGKEVIVRHRMPEVLGGIKRNGGE